MAGLPAVALQIDLHDIALLHAEKTQAALRLLQCSRTRVGQVQLQVLQCFRRCRALTPINWGKHTKCYESLSDGAQQENSSLQKTKLPLHWDVLCTA